MFHIPNIFLWNLSYYKTLYRCALETYCNCVSYNEAEGTCAFARSKEIIEYLKVKLNY